MTVCECTDVGVGEQRKREVRIGEKEKRGRDESRPYSGMILLALEGEFQGHLDLAGAADGFVDDADAAQGWRGIEWGAVDWEIVEVQVLGDVVDGDVEAGSVG
jgi:hypothetical protein